MSSHACGLCGKTPAAGFAAINGVRYCHGDDDPKVTCYMRAEWRTGVSPLRRHPETKED